MLLSATAEILEEARQQCRPRARRVLRGGKNTDLRRRPLELFLKGGQRRELCTHIDAPEAGTVVMPGHASRARLPAIRKAGMNSLESRALRLRRERPTNCCAAQFPGPSCGIVYSAEAPAIAAILPGSEVFDVQGEQRLHLTGHPRQRHIRKSVLLITASDIGVHAGEPHLHQFLGARGLSGGRLDPQGRSKVGAPLIQGERVERIFDVRAQGRVMKLVELRKNLVEMTWNPQFPDCVPDAYAFYRDVLVAQRKMPEHIGLSRLIL